MNQKADHAQVIAAFALPIVLVAVAGWFAWTETWNRAEGELLRTADGASELAHRVFSSASLAARLTNTVLTGVSDADLQENEEQYHQQLAGIMEELPGSNMISVSDSTGALTLTSGQFPVTRISMADREWVQVLQADDPPSVYVGTLAESRVTGSPFFSISVARSGSGNAALGRSYDGIITVSLDPYKIAQELRSTTQEDDDVISLVRADGEILTSTRGEWTKVPRVPATSQLLTLIAQGTTQGIYEGQSIGLREGIPLGRGILIAFKQIGDLPVYATVSRTPRAIIAPWLQTMTALLAVGLPTSLALGLLSLTSLRRRNALGDSEAELRAAFENAATGTALIDSKTNRILKVNNRLCEIAGRDAAALVETTMDQLLEADTEGSDDDAMRLNRLERPDGSIRWIELGTAPVTSPRITDRSLVIATFHDITERRKSQESQILLAREVDHRAKNVLAIVQALVRIEREPGAKTYVKRVEGRIRALARAHELLAKDGWHGVGLSHLVHDELAAYQNGAQVSVSGPDVVISSSAVQPLSMIVHELATNAVKHGALSHPTGKLSVSWRAHHQSGGVELNWQEERGAEMGDAAAAGGSGLTIIQGSVGQLGGEAEFQWCTTGLVCRIILPSAVLATGEGAQALDPDAPPDAHTRAEQNEFAGMRALLAEDEVLLALDMQELLEGVGCEVIGPAHSLEEARRLAEMEAGRIDVALLDVNLSGVTSVELARELGRAGVGVLLVTGYSEIPGQEKSDSWIQLRKPVTEQDVVTALQNLARSSLVSH